MSNNFLVIFFTGFDKASAVKFEIDAENLPAGICLVQQKIENCEPCIPKSWNWWIIQRNGVF